MSQTQGRLVLVGFSQIPGTPTDAARHRQSAIPTQPSKKTEIATSFHGQWRELHDVSAIAYILSV